MFHSKPIADTIVRDDFTTDKIKGGNGNEHLIHHRDPSVDAHSSTGLVGGAGDDILEASVPDRGQVHMFAATGNDWFILDVTKIANANGAQGHHAYGGNGHNTFQFANIDKNLSPILGRLDDFDPSSDQILIDGTAIDLADLPKTITLSSGNSVFVRVIEIDHPEFAAENLGAQHFLAIGDNIFYALEGARDLGNGTSGLTGEERHFLHPDALTALRNAETVDYVNPVNFVPHDFYAHREDDLTLSWVPQGLDVTGDPGENSAVNMFGGKGNIDAHSSTGAQTMRGTLGDDVINGNTGNDTIYGDYGDDLIAGGIDNDTLYGGPGNDIIWGGDGDDRLYGGRGNDILFGGRGNDLLVGGEGDDVLVAGRGDNVLVGAGGDDSINRFHFQIGGGNNTITDFKIEADQITLQHDIDPVSVELWENSAGNTVMNYGQSGSVELQGVPLSEFQQLAEIRAEFDDPVITITPDPQDEALHDLRVKIGAYGAEDTPSLFIDGLLYGNAAFFDDAAGGYTYVSASDLTDVPDPPAIPEEEDEEEDEDDEEEDKKNADTTCFIATAAYRDPRHPDVVFLRAFRDQWLVRYQLGRTFIRFYWWIGPKLAIAVGRNAGIAQAAKALIAACVVLLRKVWKHAAPTSPIAQHLTDSVSAPKV